MTDLEDRLYLELPELADALVDGGAEREEPEQATPSAIPNRSRRRLLAGAAALTTIGVGAAWLNGIGSQGQTSVVTATDTGTSGSSDAGLSDFGSWVPIDDAPISTRPFALSAWTGSRAVFFGGSNAERNFAHTNGAFYDPATDSWETMRTPGFGHPGFSGGFLGGDLYATAKGGITRIDIESGREVPVARPPLTISEIVELDGDLWAVGSTNGFREVVSIARYRVVDELWDSPIEQKSPLEGFGEAIQNRSAVVGDLDGEIVLCSEEGNCLAFDSAVSPEDGAWRSIVRPETGDVPGISGVTAHGLVRLSLSGKDGRSAALHVFDGDSWTRRAEDVPVAGFTDTTSITAAGDWLIVLSEQSEPVVVHLPTGDWGLTPWPLDGVRWPNVVWTGEQLVVWGGVAEQDAAAEGALWTPSSG